jgi:Uma2 family endonuclease
MNGAVPKPGTIDDFEQWERRQPDRYERIGGIVRMMVGGTADHSTIAGNLFARLRPHLRGHPCRVFVEGPKVIVGDALAYPDLAITCTPMGGKDMTVPDPVILVEVMSRSTADYDRGSKWLAYQQIGSLEQYVLISQDEVRVDVFSRVGDRWEYRIIDELPSKLSLPTIDLDVPLAEIYEDTSLAG